MLKIPWAESCEKIGQTIFGIQCFQRDNLRKTGRKSICSQLLGYVALVAALMSIPGSAAGHHGWAEFDVNTDVTLEITVTAFHFVNPHCVVEFERKDETGKVHDWQGEFSNVGQLARKGWNAATIQPGDKVRIRGNLPKNGAPAVHIRWIRLANGQEYKIE